MKNGHLNPYTPRQERVEFDIFGTHSEHRRRIALVRIGDNLYLGINWHTRTFDESGYAISNPTRMKDLTKTLTPHLGASLAKALIKQMTSYNW